MSKKPMANSQMEIESLKLLQDWSKWLVSLEAGACALLWSKVAASSALFFGWMMFMASIIGAGLLLICIPFVIGRIGINPDGKRGMKKVWTLVAFEFAFFLAGCICLAYRLWDPKA